MELSRVVVGSEVGDEAMILTQNGERSCLVKKKLLDQLMGLSVDCPKIDTAPLDNQRLFVGVVDEEKEKIVPLALGSGRFFLRLIGRLISGDPNDSQVLSQCCMEVCDSLVKVADLLKPAEITNFLRSDQDDSGAVAELERRLMLEAAQDEKSSPGTPRFDPLEQDTDIFYPSGRPCQGLFLKTNGWGDSGLSSGPSLLKRVSTVPLSGAGGRVGDKFSQYYGIQVPVVPAGEFKTNLNF